MLDKLTQKIMDSIHRSAKDTIIPMKEAMKKNVDMQVNIGSGLLKFGTMILLFFGVLKMSSSDDERKTKPELPSTIVINNYINKGDEPKE